MTNFRRSDLLSGSVPSRLAMSSGMTDAAAMADELVVESVLDMVIPSAVGEGGVGFERGDRRFEAAVTGVLSVQKRVEFIERSPNGRDRALAGLFRVDETQMLRTLRRRGMRARHR